MEGALAIYATEASINLHIDRMSRKRYLQFFSSEPKAGLFQPGWLDVEYKDAKQYRDDLEALMDMELKPTAAKPLMDALQQTVIPQDGKKVVRLDRAVVFPAIHELLGYFLNAFWTKLNAGTRNSKRAKEDYLLVRTQISYRRLTQFTVGMKALIKVYIDAIDEATIASQNDDHVPAKDSDVLEPEEDQDEDDDMAHDRYTTDNNEADRHIRELNPTNGFKGSDWGQYAHLWLAAIVAQYRSILILLRELKSDEFRVQFLYGTPRVEPHHVPSADMALWAKQTELQKAIGNPTLLSNVDTLMKHRQQADDQFEGTFHAELIVAAALLESHGDEGFAIGISRRPCYFCYQALTKIAASVEQRGGMHFRPVQSSGATWKVDFSDSPPVEIIEEVWDQTVTDTASLFQKHRQ